MGTSLDGVAATTDRRVTGAGVAFQAVEKLYGDVPALRPTSFDIPPGEFFAILGPSGSGKSTLLGIAAGYVTPTHGRLLLNGRNVVGQAPYRRNIGMVFQNYALFPHMTVAENISFPLRMRRLPKPEIERRVRRMIDIVRLSGLEDRRPTQLSGGQQQRVALARAAVYDPLLLLMDEPLGALDKNLRETVQDEIKRFQRELGATVIYVTHDQQEAASLADRIAIMRAGAIVQVGTPRQLYEKPVNVFVASFLGEANMFPVSARGETTRDVTTVTAGQGLTMQARTAPVSDLPVVACVRPESILLADEAAGADNQYDATVMDVTYAVGSFRYLVRLPDGTVVTLRRKTAHDDRVHAVGDVILVGWRADDTLLIPAE